MWSQLIYLMPIASFMSMIELKEDETLNGDLYEELDKMIRKYIDHDRFVLRADKGFEAHVDLTFQKGMTLWHVMSTILHRYRLAPELGATENGAVTLTLKEGSAWRH